jgi:hypothetical protein
MPVMALDRNGHRDDGHTGEWEEAESDRDQMTFHCGRPSARNWLFTTSRPLPQLGWQGRLEGICGVDRP